MACLCGSFEIACRANCDYGLHWFTILHKYGYIVVAAETDNMKIRLQAYCSFFPHKIGSPYRNFKFYSILALRLQAALAKTSYYRALLNK